MIDKIVNHSRMVLKIAEKHGWLIGARYTNLRDVKTFPQVHFIDIDWKNYDFKKHLEAVKKCNPKYTVAKDWEKKNELRKILREAQILADYCENVIIVPKVDEVKDKILDLIPERFMLGFSVPSKYGKTSIDPKYFDGRPVHLLGGRPEVQLQLAKKLNVKSLDCNRFTLDARYGDYFNGLKFIPHPVGGYKTCLTDSIKNINKLWRKHNKL
jgi:hypothetical protein